MTALAANLMIDTEKWTRKQLPLGPSLKAYQGAMACADISAHTVKPAVASNANLKLLGVFAETVDNTSTTATALVNVEFLAEKTVLWRANGNSITVASNMFALAYALDDATVTSSSSGNSAMGTIVGVDSVLGVAVMVPALT